LRVARLGFGVYMRCPVGKHWSLVKRVAEIDLTEQERQTLELQPPVDISEGAKLNGAIGVFIGLFSLTMSIVTQSWWLVPVCVVWITLSAALLVIGYRRPAIGDRDS
jgi:hypothetical protein